VKASEVSTNAAYGCLIWYRERGPFVAVSSADWASSEAVARAQIQGKRTRLRQQLEQQLKRLEELNPLTMPVTTV
jgi:hypothetical protein